MKYWGMLAMKHFGKDANCLHVGWHVNSCSFVDLTVKHANAANNPFHNRHKKLGPQWSYSNHGNHTETPSRQQVSLHRISIGKTIKLGVKWLNAVETPFPCNFVENFHEIRRHHTFPNMPVGYARFTTYLFWLIFRHVAFLRMGKVKCGKKLIQYSAPCMENGAQRKITVLVKFVTRVLIGSYTDDLSPHFLYTYFYFSS